MKSNRIPDPKNATVALTFDGISLSCFTNDHKKQMAFIREPFHVLSLEISEVSATGVVRVPHSLNLNPKQQIVVEATDPIFPVSTWFEPANFDRINGKYDFRFVTDLERDLHGHQLNLKNSTAHPKRHDITLMTISNAHFYTTELYGPVDKVDSQTGTATDFGLIADTVGADIFCGDASGSAVLIHNGNHQNEVRLEKKPGIRYLIAVDNSCPVHSVGAGPTDFTLCYALAFDPTDIEYDLRRRTGYYSGDDPCQGGTLGITNDLSSLL